MLKLEINILHLPIQVSICSPLVTYRISSATLPTSSICFLLDYFCLRSFCTQTTDSKVVSIQWITHPHWLFQGKEMGWTSSLSDVCMQSFWIKKWNWLQQAKSSLNINFCFCYTKHYLASSQEIYTGDSETISAV